MEPLLVRGAAALTLWNQAVAWLQPAFLLLIRLCWGYAFAVSGWGKLGHIADVAKWFGDTLHIPFPLLNAYAAATTELVGGVCLLLGLGGRIATVPLIVTMVVAYLTSDYGALTSLWLSEAACEADAICVDFVKAAPFGYLMASLLVFLFGPGGLSVDGALALWWKARQPAAAPPTGSSGG